MAADSYIGGGKRSARRKLSNFLTYCPVARAGCGLHSCMLTILYAKDLYTDNKNVGSLNKILKLSDFERLTQDKGRPNKPGINILHL